MSRRSSFPIHFGAYTGVTRNRRCGGAELELLFELCIITLVLALLPPLLQFADHSGDRGDHSRTHCINKLKNISLALHNYNNTYGGLPPAYTVDADGKPLHSWRTLILPYLDQRSLYEKIDLSKPWDDPVNAEAAATYVSEYDCPSTYSELEPNRTVYLAVVTPDSCIRPTKMRPISEVTDGLPNTLMVIEVPVKYAVPWMSPQDADLQLVSSSISGEDLQHSSGFTAGLADGRVKFLSSEISAATLRSLTTAAQGDVVGEF
ncbi:hypothetical protein CA54_39100 [Symmachiella macrocystis]|uniref:DUF1559 domain-containing protein n=1 Tax=Symmachiella macrocystis TaxID=2527985 RepID=A0A5C6BE09_9PLAN|nr:DUF1559 domain-containing protein [Symmachiella macrocystis]TWU08674.1 hypothetical protein CA54_39100 [Symmachiella macrocystis]